MATTELIGGFLIVLILLLYPLFYYYFNRKLPVFIRDTVKLGLLKDLKPLLIKTQTDMAQSEEFKNSIAEVLVAVFESSGENEEDLKEVDPARKIEIEKATMTATMEAIGQEQPMLAFIGRRLYGDEWMKVIQERPEELKIVMAAVEKSGLARMFDAFTSTSPQPGNTGNLAQISSQNPQSDKYQW